MSSFNLPAQLRSSAGRLQLAQEQPENFAALYGNMDPSPGQRRLMNAIASDAPEHKQIVVKVHRKGGKTLTVANAYAYILKKHPETRIFHMAGSFLQASRLYDHFKPIITNPELDYHILGEPTRYWTRFQEGGFLEVLTASAKSIRGGDSDILGIDEAVLVPQPLINAAWPLVRASKVGKRVITSTASAEINLEWFVNLWQNAKRLKFERIEWPESECHWINKEDRELASLMLDSQTLAVEYGGAIAERKGHVWDNQLIDDALVDPRRTEEYPPVAADPLTEKWTSLDWGFIGQAVLLFWEKMGDTVYVRDCRIWTETSYTEIKQEIVEDYGKYPIYPDSEAVSDNEDLRKMGMHVNPVIFSKEKEPYISRVRWRLEHKLIKIPNPDITDLTQGIDGGKYFSLIQQLKAYHYNEKTGKPMKVNDHACDAVICGMKHLEVDHRAPVVKHSSKR